jgi:hypothetical protein
VSPACVALLGPFPNLGAVHAFLERRPRYLRRLLAVPLFAGGEGRQRGIGCLAEVVVVRRHWLHSGAVRSSCSCRTELSEKPAVSRVSNAECSVHPLSGRRFSLATSGTSGHCFHGCEGGRLLSCGGHLRGRQSRFRRRRVLIVPRRSRCCWSGCPRRLPGPWMAALGGPWTSRSTSCLPCSRCWNVSRARSVLLMPQL